MKKNVGLLVIATGKYTRFVSPLWESAKKWFLKNHNVTLFLFTDNLSFKLEQNQILIPQQHMPWPGPTLFRYNIFNQAKEQLSKMDYLFYCDADMLFVNEVGEEVFGDLVATKHPGFYKSQRQAFTYETNPASKACVKASEGQMYYAGGFNGGTSEAYLKMCQVISDKVADDYSRDIIAVWHDESHMNRYFIDNPPTTVLSPSYCYPESWALDVEKKLLALDKNHKEMRT